MFLVTGVMIRDVRLNRRTYSNALVPFSLLQHNSHQPGFVFLFSYAVPSDGCFSEALRQEACSCVCVCMCECARVCMVVCHRELFLLPIIFIIIFPFLHSYRIRSCICALILEGWWQTMLPIWPQSSLIWEPYGDLLACLAILLSQVTYKA